MLKKMGIDFGCFSAVGPDMEYVGRSRLHYLVAGKWRVARGLNKNWNMGRPAANANRIKQTCGANETKYIQHQQVNVH
jgi:hypothetical protein